MIKLYSKINCGLGPYRKYIYVFGERSGVVVELRTPLASPCCVLEQGTLTLHSTG